MLNSRLLKFSAHRGGRLTHLNFASALHSFSFDIEPGEAGAAEDICRGTGRRLFASCHWPLWDLRNFFRHLSEHHPGRGCGSAKLPYTSMHVGPVPCFSLCLGILPFSLSCSSSGAGLGNTTSVVVRCHGSIDFGLPGSQRPFKPQKLNRHPSDPPRLRHSHVHHVCASCAPPGPVSNSENGPI